MTEYLSPAEVKDLVIRSRSGDDEAWEILYNNFEKYIHDRAWKQLKKIEMPREKKSDMEQELYQAGWEGFLYAVKSYNPQKGEFLTYATHFIDGEIKKEMSYHLNSQGITECLDDVSTVVLLKRLSYDNNEISVTSGSDRGGYQRERCALQIMEILRLLTDEDHSLSKNELGELLRLYRVAKYGNGTPLESKNTFTSIINGMLLELNPLSYTGKNDRDYRIKYEGYKENRLKAKINKEKGKRAADITGFSYVHLFSKEEMDRLIQIVCFSDMLSNEDKKLFVERLTATASTYYHTPFLMEMGKGKNKLRFHPQAVHGRFSGRVLADRSQLADNINRIQHAINNLSQIRFRFNCYTAAHELKPKSEYLHILSPYHLVAYHEHYYCIGMKEADQRIWHYRVDLMSDVEILTDKDGKPVRINVCAFDGLPICNALWNPEEYMAEHLYMGYDEPREIRIRLRADDYTILHDWFGDHYEKVGEIIVTEDDGREVEYDIAKVKTSPSMMVHWAMQYAGTMEILDEEIRENIREEIKKLQGKYV